MSLSEFGIGLERITGEKVKLKIKDFDINNIPILTNVENIINDLRLIKKKVEEDGNIQLKGYIEDIETEINKVIISCPRENGVVHFFETSGKDIPLKDITKLKMGTEVNITLRLAKDKELWITQELSQYEINSLPKKLRYDFNRLRIFFPYCLEQADLQGWLTSNDLKELIVKRSWQYSFSAQFNILEEGEIVEGEVIELTRYGDTGKISGAKVKIRKEEAELMGFVPMKFLKQTPVVGQLLKLKVLSAEGSETILSEIEE